MSKLWFKRRRYGYGWTPVAWQGWLAIAIYVALLVGAAYVAGDDLNAGELLAFLIFVVITTLLLFVVSYYKGPRPKWRWGKHSGDNPEEDL